MSAMSVLNSHSEEGWQLVSGRYVKGFGRRASPLSSVVVLQALAVPSQFAKRLTLLPTPSYAFSSARVACVRAQISVQIGVARATMYSIIFPLYTECYTYEHLSDACHFCQTDSFLKSLAVFFPLRFAASRHNSHDSPPTNFELLNAAKKKKKG